MQKDHWDWGFRLSPIFGETYRYTTAFGFFSEQLQKWNKFAGFDVPMAYGEVYIPWILEGLIHPLRPLYLAARHRSAARAE